MPRKLNVVRNCCNMPHVCGILTQINLMLPIKRLPVRNNFFNELGVKTRLSDYGVGIDTIDRIEKRFRERGIFALGGIDDVNVDNVRAILTSRL